MGEFYLPLLSIKSEGQSALLASVFVSQMPFTKNNQYAQMAYFRVICAEFLQQHAAISS